MHPPLLKMLVDGFLRKTYLRQGEDQIILQRLIGPFRLSDDPRRMPLTAVAQSKTLWLQKSIPRFSLCNDHICPVLASRFVSPKRRKLGGLSPVMLPGQASAATMLLQCKLTVRRLVRHWRSRSREGSRAKGSGLLDTGGGDSGSETDIRVPTRTRGARLPARPPDRVHTAGVAVCLFVVALCVRCYRIAEPAAVVFDELHFGKFVNGYWDGQYTFDIVSLYAQMLVLRGRLT